MSNIDSAIIAQKLLEDLVFCFGCPSEIITDQGADLISDRITKTAKISKIKPFKRTAIHPEIIESLERSHHSLIE